MVPRLTLRGHQLPVLSVAFSPDGRTLASTGGDPADFDPERGLLGEVKLWDLDRGKEKASYRGHGDIVFAATFSPDGKTLATASRDGTAKLWDLAAGKERFTFEDHDAEVRSVAFSPDGKTLATAGADGTARLWDVAGGKEVRQLEVKDSAVTCVRFAPDGKTLAGGVTAGGNPRFGVPGGAATIALWDVATGKARPALRGHKGQVHALHFTADGKTLVSAGGLPGQPGEVLVWDAAGGALLARLDGHHGPVGGLAFSPDGRTLLSAGGSLDNQGEILFWQPPANGDRHTLEGHAGPVTCAAYSQDGKTLATGGEDRTVRLWDTATGTERAVFKGFANPLHCLQMSPDGRALATAGRGEKTVTLSTLTGRLLLAGHTLEITGVAFAPDGRLIAISAGAENATGQQVKLWDAETGKEVATLPPKKGTARCVTFSPNGRTLAVGFGQEVRFWHLPSLIEQESWKPAGPVSALQYSADGTMLAVGQSDGTITVWDVAGGREFATLEGLTGAVTTLAFAPDHRTLTAAAGQGGARVWLLPAPPKALAGKAVGPKGNEE
jgi:WD40 repeat protein